MPWELNDLEQLLVTTIENAVGHERIYNSFRAARGAGAHSPFVVFRAVPGPGDSRGQKNVRYFARPKYDITVCTKGSATDESEAQVGQMDDALQALQGTPAGPFTVNCIRLDVLSYESPGLTAEEFYVYRGGTYQSWVANSND